MARCTTCGSNEATIVETFEGRTITCPNDGDTTDAHLEGGPRDGETHTVNAHGGPPPAMHLDHPDSADRPVVHYRHAEGSRYVHAPR